MTIAHWPPLSAREPSRRRYRTRRSARCKRPKSGRSWLIGRNSGRRVVSGRLAATSFIIFRDDADLPLSSISHGALAQVGTPPFFASCYNDLLRLISARCISRWFSLPPSDDRTCHEEVIVGATAASGSRRVTFDGQIGLAPGVPHFANLPLAALHRVGFAGAADGHLVNLPFASLQGAANAGAPASRDKEAAANRSLRMTISSAQHGRNQAMRSCRWRN